MLRNITRNRHKPKTTFARHLRQNQTLGELVLWKKIRNKKFHGLKFRRQVPIGPYIADFLCVEKKLIIEIDGDSHFQIGAKERDDKREAYIRAEGFEVLRFSNNLAVESVDSILIDIEVFLGMHSD